VLQQSGSSDDLVDALLAASRALVAVAARSLADAGDITLPQYRALIVLATRPGITVGDLAAALDVHPSTATRLCDRLVAKKLVRRAQSPEDRRSIRLELAAAGTRVVEQVTGRRRRDLAAIAARMPAEAATAAVAALTAFAEAAGPVTGADPFGWPAPSFRGRSAASGRRETTPEGEVEAR
jgi:DNA-binding MarR family transcriptional regulator